MRRAVNYNATSVGRISYNSLYIRYNFTLKVFFGEVKNIKTC